MQSPFLIFGTKIYCAHSSIKSSHAVPAPVGFSIFHMFFFLIPSLNTNLYIH